MYSEAARAVTDEGHILHPNYTNLGLFVEHPKREKNTFSLAIIQPIFCCVLANTIFVLPTISVQYTDILMGSQH